MRINVGRILVAIILLLSSLAAIPFLPDSRAETVENIYFLHAESTSGIGTDMDLRLTSPEPNPITISVDVSNPGSFLIGDGWIQMDNYDYQRNMSGVWTFTMYAYCDDNIINGQLSARVFDGLRNRLNNVQNKSQLIGPCDNPNAPVEIIWDQELDSPLAGTFVDGERFRVEIWFDAISGGTTPTIRTSSGENSVQGQIIAGTYMDTQTNNEGGTQYEHLREEISPCGISTIFDVIAEIIVEGKSIGGDYTSLHANDDVVEEIGEDGNPNSINWTWAIDISPGSGQYRFYLDANYTAPVNDDNFTVSYSTTGAFLGEEVTIFTINETWVGSPSDPPPARFDFPAGTLTGVPTVYIRLLDTNENDWPQIKDALRLDRMYIELVESTSNCSVMEHIWAIDNVPAAFVHKLFVSGNHSPSSDGDEFRFSYSAISSLGPYVDDIFLLTNTTDEDYYLTTDVFGPPGFTKLWVRVEDTDRTGSASPSLDDLFVDHIYLSTAGGGTTFQFHLLVDNATYSSKIKTVEDATADTMKPTSTVLNLPLYSGPVFDIEFVASDIGAGVHHVELWYILPDDTHVQYLGAFTTSPISFTAPGDGRYYFYTMAVDNALNYEDRPLTFDAMTIVDTTSPSVTEVRPGNERKDVDLESRITIRFSETMDSSSVDQAFILIEGDNGRLWNANDGTIAWNHPSNNSFTFTLSGGEAFKYGTEYTIMLDSTASDLAGNGLLVDFQSTFETEYEFNPVGLILMIVVAVIIMVTVLVYFLFFKKQPSEEEEPIPEAVQTPSTPPLQPPVPQYQPPATYVPPPVTLAPPPADTPDRPLWQSEKSPEEMWKEDRAGVSACNLCGRFISTEAQYCPHCGSRTTVKRSP
jgi:hypothetical protein